MTIEGSPFVISGPAQPDEVVGRREILATLWDRAVRGRFVLLTAPRRYGKTTLVHRLRRDAERSKDIDVLVVDLLGIQTLDDLTVRLAQAWSRLPKGPLARAAAAALPYIKGLDVGGGVVTLHLQSPAGPATSTLEAVLDMPRRVAERTGRRLLVVLDEFQSVASVARADAIMRSQIQHHTDQVSYLFCGSEHSTLRMLFQDRARPLYGQAEQIELASFDHEELADYVVHGMASGGRAIEPEALSAYLAFVDGHPQRSMLVADCAWATTSHGDTIDLPVVAGAIDEALRRCRPEFDGLWSLLSPAQGKLARLLAWEEPITGAAAQRLGLAQGSARAAATKLEGLGLITENPDSHGRYRLTDPLLGEWLRRLGARP